MKDRVFIIWSGNNTVALKVKEKLEKQQYICIVGGNSDNNSRYASVGDTVLSQIKACNQAIVIFQKKENDTVSNNLFFELGYVLAMYGMTKVHCVKKINEQVELPSDFDNSFIETINETDDDAFTDGIVRSFFERQKMSVRENKMYLINNRYLLHEKIAAHYSPEGSKCSDYELAQYLLFYLQAAYMFEDEERVGKEISALAENHFHDISDELKLSVNICLSYLKMVQNIQIDETTREVYISRDVFWEFKKAYSLYERSVVQDDIGLFAEWANIFIAQHFSFASMLFANNTQIDEETRKNLRTKQAEYSLKTLDLIVVLLRQLSGDEKNDENGLLSLLRSYCYRNLFLAKKALQEDDADEWLEKTLQEREKLKNNFGRGTIDTQLYNNFCMEYYLSLVNYLSYKTDVDPFDKEMYISEIREYLNSLAKEKNKNAYIQQIALWCDQAEQK